MAVLRRGPPRWREVEGWCDEGRGWGIKESMTARTTSHCKVGMECRRCRCGAEGQE